MHSLCLVTGLFVASRASKLSKAMSPLEQQQLSKQHATEVFGSTNREKRSPQEWNPTLAFELECIEEACNLEELREFPVSLNNAEETYFEYHLHRNATSSGSFCNDIGKFQLTSAGVSCNCTAPYGGKFCKTPSELASAGFPEFTGDISFRDALHGKKPYFRYAYQYGFTSYDNMSPLAIIQPAGVEDIQKAVRYAASKNIGIAVRTGGHQYSGASSTSGQHIQLDMKKTFKEKSYNTATNIARYGVSNSLEQLDIFNLKHGIAFPQGVCAHVHLGGHVQTGGYGFMNRAFGLLSDHVIAIEVVLADGTWQMIRRPSTQIDNKKLEELISHNKTIDELTHDDLYFAILGGSPGNYGILTHVWIRPIRDADHPNSRGLYITTRYTESKFQDLLNVMAEMNKDKNLPGDFDIAMTTASNGFSKIMPRGFRRIFRKWKPEEYNQDVKMMMDYPEQYGEGTAAGEASEIEMTLPLPGKLPGMFVNLQWANLGGASQQFGASEQKWFDKIHRIIRRDTMDGIRAALKKSFLVALRQSFGELLAKEANFKYVFDEKVHTPLSEMISRSVFYDVREYIKPYEKRFYYSDKTDLISNGWTKTMTKQHQRIMEGDDEHIDLMSQFFVIGGQHSRFAKQDDGITSHSFRQDFKFGGSYDLFYQPANFDDATKDARLKKVRQIHEDNDKETLPGGKFSDRDMRVLAFSFAKKEDPHFGANLTSVREKYYDSEQKYQRLALVKRKYDPKHVFTANSFSVGADTAEESKQILITERGSVRSEDSKSSYSCDGELAKPNSRIEWVDGTTFTFRSSPAEILHEFRNFQTYMKNYCRSFSTDSKRPPKKLEARVDLKKQMKSYSKCVDNVCGETRHGTTTELSKFIRKFLDAMQANEKCKKGLLACRLPCKVKVHQCLGCDI